MPPTRPRVRFKEFEEELSGLIGARVRFPLEAGRAVVGVVGRSPEGVLFVEGKEEHRPDTAGRWVLTVRRLSRLLVV